MNAPTPAQLKEILRLIVLALRSQYQPMTILNIADTLEALSNEIFEDNAEVDDVRQK